MAMDLEKALLEGLPPYTGGTMVPQVFLAGDGLYDSRSLENPDDFPYYTDGAEMTADEFRSVLVRFYVEGVHYDYHFTCDGSIGVFIIWRDRILDIRLKDGKVSIRYLDDYCGVPRRQAQVRLVTGTDKEAFLAYVEQLKKLGLEEIYAHERENNLYRELQGYGYLLDCSFNGASGEARFVRDEVSVPIADYGYKTVKTDGHTEIYQFGLTHARMRPGFSCDCGMCYLIKLADNSIVMVDGGEIEQCTEKATAALMDLLHKLSGTKPGEKIRLAGWYCTHAHDDHMDMFTHIIGRYHDEIELERVFFNFPSTEANWILPSTYVMINRVNKYYPNVRYRKVHMGDRFVLADTEFEVLQCHEQGLTPVGYTWRGGLNNTSSVLKVSFDGVSLMLLGDIDDEAEAILVNNFTKETLHADVVQVAHHLFNRLEKLYDLIDADMALVPQNSCCSTPRDGDYHKYLLVRNTVPEDQFYFAADATYGFRAENGKIACFAKFPHPTDLYDGSEF